MGVAFSIGAITPGKLATLILFTLANVLLLAHIFLFNDWAATTQNAQQPNTATALVYRGDISSRFLFLFSVALLGAGLFLFTVVGLRTLILAAAYAALGIFYSHPWVNAKGKPIGSSVAHFLGGVLHFLVGYTLFAPLDQRGVLIGLFFAFTFTAGHLNHEVHDFDYDLQNNLRTNAVVFGKRAIFVASLILFTIAYGWLVFLALAGLVPRLLVLWPIALCPLHLIWARSVLRRGITSEAVNRFRTRYRLIYGLIGAGIFFTLFTHW